MTPIASIPSFFLRLLLLFALLPLSLAGGAGDTDIFSINFNWEKVKPEDVRDIDVRARDNYGNSPLHWAAFNPNPAVISLLLDRGADIHAQDKLAAMTPLHWVAQHNENPDVAALLLDRGADVNARSRYGRTPLHWAAATNQNPDVVALLLDRGADIHARDKYERTPLHEAAGTSDTPEMILLLLRRGADAGAKDDRGETALDLLEHNRKLSQSDAYRQLRDALRR